MSGNTCSRCGRDIERPIPENGNYVSGDDFVEDVPTPVLIGKKHTPESKSRLNSLDKVLDVPRGQIESSFSHEDAPAEVEYEWGKTRSRDGTEIPKTYTHPFRCVTFEDVEIPDIAAAHEDPDIVRVEKHIEGRPVQKTGVVCIGCTKNGDEVIWGPAK